MNTKVVFGDIFVSCCFVCTFFNHASVCLHIMFSNLFLCMCLHVFLMLFVFFFILFIILCILFYSFVFLICLFFFLKKEKACMELGVWEGEEDQGGDG